MFKILLILICASNFALAGNFTFTPEQPKVGEEVSFILDELPKGIDISSVQVIAYRYDNHQSNYPYAEEIAMKPTGEGGKFAGVIKADINVVYNLFVVKYVIDGRFFRNTNEGNFWELMYYHGSNPVRGAMLASALTYMGNQPEGITRNVNYTEARKRLEKETETYPLGIQAQIGFISLLFDTKRITQQAFETRLNAVVRGAYDADSENEIKSISRALKALNRGDEANRLELAFAKKYPTSNIAEETLLAQLSTASSFKQFVDICEIYFKQFPNSTNRDRIFNAYSTAFLQSGKLEELAASLDKLENVPPNVLGLIASEIIYNPKVMKNEDKTKRIIAAKDYFLKAYNMFDEGKNPLTKQRYYTERQWNKAMRLAKSSIAEIGGNIHLEAGGFATAEKYYAEAIKLAGDDANKAVFVNYITTLKNLNQDSLAFEVGLSAFLQSKESDTLEVMFKELFEKMGYEDDFDEYINAIKDTATFERRVNLASELISIELPPSVLSTPDGRFEDLMEYNGQVVALMFFSTWCGPCQAMYPGWEQITKKYAEHESVQVFAINIWEQEKDRGKALEKFLSELPLDMKILLDETDMIATRAGIQGLPTVALIDADGKISYFINGFTNEKEFVRTAEDIIEILLD